MPDKFESGTANLPGIFGFKAAVDFILETGVETMRAHETRMCRRFLEGLKDIPDIRVAGPAGLEDRVAVISVDFKNIDNAEASFHLELDYGIMTRCGLHCAPNAHKTLDTFPQGTVRFSPGWFTTDEEITYDISGEYWLDEATEGGQNSLGVGAYHEHARNYLEASVAALTLKGTTQLGKQ